MLLGYDEEEYNSVIDFVKSTKERRAKFKELYEKDIEEWDYDDCDEDIIRDMLEQEEDKYIMLFIDTDNDGYFKILKVDTTDTTNTRSCPNRNDATQIKKIRKTR
jgi:hypothetical protein